MDRTQMTFYKSFWDAINGLPKKDQLPVFKQLVKKSYLLLPLIVAIGYEINRLVGRYDNALTRALTAPGMWFQNFTTNEPDDSMIEVGIAAVQAVLPEVEGQDAW